jgi:glyoxalase superfamily protein
VSFPETDGEAMPDLRRGEIMAIQVTALAFDCVDAARLAGFWARVLEREVDEGGDEKFAAIGLADPSPHHLHFLFERVPEGKTAKNRVHPDLLVEDLENEVRRLVGLGATRLAEVAVGGYRWVTLADPEGNEFDVVRAVA